MGIVAIIQHVRNMQLKQFVGMALTGDLVCGKGACSVLIHGELVVTTQFCQKKMSRFLKITGSEYYDYFDVSNARNGNKNYAF